MKTFEMEVRLVIFCPLKYFSLTVMSYFVHRDIVV